MGSRRGFALVIASVFLGFFLFSVAGVMHDIDSTEQFITEHELPTIGRSIRTNFILSATQYGKIGEQLLAGDYLKNWILSGEQDIDELISFLEDVRAKYDLIDASLVSNQSETYYGSDGRVLALSPTNWERDGWFYLFRDAVQDSKSYSNIDSWFYPEENILGLYINVPLFCDNGDFIGVTGGAIDAAKIQQMLVDYEQEYGINIFLVRRDGSIVYSSNPLTTQTRTYIDNLINNPIMESIRRQRNSPGTSIIETDSPVNPLVWNSFLASWDTHLIISMDGRLMSQRIWERTWTSVLRNGVLGLILFSISAMSIFLVYRRAQAGQRKLSTETALRDGVLYLQNTLLHQAMAGAGSTSASTPVETTAADKTSGLIQKKSDIEQLLKMFQSEESPIVLEEFNLQQLIESLLLAKQPLASSHDVNLYSTHARQLPPVAGLPGVTQLVFEELLTCLIVDSANGANILLSSSFSKRVKITLIVQSQNSCRRVEIEEFLQLWGEIIGIEFHKEHDPKKGLVLEFYFQSRTQPL